MGSWGSVVGEGRGCRRLIEAEAGATGAICVECVDWKRRGNNSNASAKKNRKSRALQSGILLRSIARFCMLCSQNAERLAERDGWNGGDVEWNGTLAQQLVKKFSLPFWTKCPSLIKKFTTVSSSRVQLPCPSYVQPCPSRVYWEKILKKLDMPRGVSDTRARQVFDTGTEP